MFTGKLRTSLLSARDLNKAFVLSDVNALLRSRHSAAKDKTPAGIDHDMKHRGMKYVVAWTDADRVAGLCILVVQDVGTYVLAAAHSLAANKGFDRTVVMKSVLDEAQKHVDHADYFDVQVAPTETHIINAIMATGLKPRQRLIFRRTLKKQVSRRKAKKKSN